MSPGPKTIKKVSRLNVHLDFTTRPRTVAISSATGGVSTLLFMTALSFLFLRRHGERADQARTPKPAKTHQMKCRRECTTAPGTWNGCLSPPRSPLNLSWKTRRPKRKKSYRTTGTPTPFPPRLGGLSSFGSIYLSGDEASSGGK